MATAHSPSMKNVDQLNNLLQGEKAAVDTYRIALSKLDAGSDARAPLDACLRSHSQRVMLLEQKIEALGGTPTKTAGTWGVVARTAENISASMGEGTSFAALESGEDHGLKCYQVDYDKLLPETLSVVTQELLPRQKETHQLMSSLKHAQKNTRHA